MMHVQHRQRGAWAIRESSLRALGRVLSRKGAGPAAGVIFTGNLYAGSEALTLIDLAGLALHVPCVHLPCDRNGWQGTTEGAAFSDRLVERGRRHGVAVAFSGEPCPMGGLA